MSSPLLRSVLVGLSAVAVSVAAVIALQAAPGWQQQRDNAALIAEAEAALLLPRADFTVPIPDGLPRLLVGLDRIVVETSGWQPPRGETEAVGAWWRENQHRAPAVIALSNGEIPEDDAKGQLSMALYEALLEVAEASKTRGEASDRSEDEFRGRVVIALDQRLPWRTVLSVLYTAGQAQFGEFILPVRGGEAVEYGVNALSQEPAVRIRSDHLVLSWFRGAGRVVIPCPWGCDPVLAEALSRMRWHRPDIPGGVIFADRDVPLSRVFAVHRLLARDTALLSVLTDVGTGGGEAVDLTTLLSEGEPLHALMEAHRQIAARISVGPVHIEGPNPLKWRRRLETLPSGMVPMGMPSMATVSALSTNDVRACLLPALIEAPERSGELTVTVRMTSASIYAVYAPWPEVSACLSRRLVGRSLSPPAFSFFSGPPDPDPDRAVATITATITEAP